MKRKAEFVALVKQLEEVKRERDRVQREIDELTAAIPELESRHRAGLNAAVMCCGCGRGLKDDGQLTVYSILQPLADSGKRGILDLSKLKELKGFASTAEADEFAAARGWQIAYDEGPNHRCPDCVKKQAVEGPTKQRGAYLNLATGEFL